MVRTATGGGWMALALALAGCGPRIEGEHCLFAGGDRGCEDDRSCMVVIGGGRVPGASQGCLDATPAAALDPEAHLHLRYGLPASLQAEGDVLASDSVQGILAREVVARGLGAVCSDTEGLMAFEGSAELSIVVSARARLDGLRGEARVRDEAAAAVRAVEATAVRDLYAQVDAWALECEGRLEGSSGTDETTGTTDASSTGSTTEGPGCVSNEECTDAAAPFCDPLTGECVRCDGLSDPDGACAAQDPAQPVCVDGACLECSGANPGACQGQTPVCDDTTNTCIPCTAHAQCGEAACDMFTGECLPADAVVHVGAGLDFATICEAIASFAAGARGTIIVHRGSYYESCTIDAGRQLALLAAAGAPPTWDAPGAQLTVMADATVFIDGLRIADNTSGVGLQMIGGQAWLDRVQLVNNAVGAEITNGAQAVFRNSTVGFLTGGGYTAIYAVDGSSVEVLYSTLIGDAGGGNSLICDPTALVTMRNSIVGNYDGNAIACAQAEISYSATTGGFPGVGNLNVGTVDTSWFLDFSSGDFHISPPYVDTFANIAQWQTGDPPIDLDGDPRPSVDGTPDFAGADVP